MFRNRHLLNGDGYRRLPLLPASRPERGKETGLVPPQNRSRSCARIAAERGESVWRGSGTRRSRSSSCTGSATLPDRRHRRLTASALLSPTTALYAPSRLSWPCASQRDLCGVRAAAGSCTHAELATRLVGAGAGAKLDRSAARRAGCDPIAPDRQRRRDRDRHTPPTEARRLAECHLIHSLTRIAPGVRRPADGTARCRAEDMACA